MPKSLYVKLDLFVPLRFTRLRKLFLKKLFVVTRLHMLTPWEIIQSINLGGTWHIWSREIKPTVWLMDVPLEPRLKLYFCEPCKSLEPLSIIHQSHFARKIGNTETCAVCLGSKWWGTRTGKGSQCPNKNFEIPESLENSLKTTIINIVWLFGSKI